ncbi:hypothetical protein ACOME3_003778 [Neoechinorhynchus agilis]
MSLKAICIMCGKDSRGKQVKGIVHFTQEREGKPLLVKAEFAGVKEGQHGFHVHEFGDLTDGCVSAGAHFNPSKSEHGGPKDKVRHVGDFGNVIANADESASFELEDHLASLAGPNSIVGRSMVLHEDPDDLGKGGFSDSKTTGHAGARIACGIIAIADPSK